RWRTRTVLYPPTTSASTSTPRSGILVPSGPTSPESIIVSLLVCHGRASLRRATTPRAPASPRRPPRTTAAPDPAPAPTEPSAFLPPPPPDSHSGTAPARAVPCIL